MVAFLKKYNSIFAIYGFLNKVFELTFLKVAVTFYLYYQILSPSVFQVSSGVPKLISYAETDQVLASSLSQHQGTQCQ